MMISPYLFRRYTAFSTAIFFYFKLYKSLMFTQAWRCTINLIFFSMITKHIIIEHAKFEINILNVSTTCRHYKIPLLLYTEVYNITSSSHWGIPVNRVFWKQNRLPSRVESMGHKTHRAVNKATNILQATFSDDFFNSLRLWPDGRKSSDDIFKCIFWNNSV